MICQLCGRDPDAIEVRRSGSETYNVGGHACHCISAEGQRVAVGICCGMMLGAEILADEIAADERRWLRKVVTDG